MSACRHEPPPQGVKGTAHLEAPDPSGAPSGPASAEPVGTEAALSSGNCDMVLKLEVQQFDRTRRLRVYVVNVSEETVSFQLPDRCPQGLVAFEGLGPGYDYYGACARGACAAPGQVRNVVLEPHHSQPVAEALIHIDGRAPCTQPLPPGRHVVRPIAPNTNLSLCVEEAIVEVPRPPSPEEGAAASKDPYFCQDSSECVLSCPRAPGCCGDTCGCRHAINKRHQVAYEANYAKTCLKPPCPAMACAYEPAHFAVCHNSRCIGTSQTFSVTP